MSLNVLVDGNNVAVRVLTSLSGYNSQFNSPHQLNFFVHSFLSNLLSISQKIKQKYNKPINLILVWDSKQSLRRKIYPEYKGNRKTKTEGEEKDKNNHYSLLNELKENLKSLGTWGAIEKEGFETDDIIAYFIKESTYDNQFIVISCDNDFFQLLGDRVIQYLPHKKAFYTYLDFKKEFGIIPDKYPFVKALAGDRGDNIKGVDQVGIKRAIKLIQSGECWQHWVNTYKEVDLELNEELIRLPFKYGEGIDLEMPKSSFNKVAWINLFQKFALQKLNILDFKNLLE